MSQPFMGAQTAQPRRLSSGPGRGSRLLRPMADSSRALAVIFTVAGLQALAIMALPHWQVERPHLVIAVAIFATVTGPPLWFLGRHLPAWTNHALLATGTSLAGLGVYGCGPSAVSMSAAYFYFWVVLYAAAYFAPRLAAAHLAFVGTTYAVALAVDPAPAYFAQWVQAMAAFTVTALIVGGFAVANQRATAATVYQSMHDSLTGLANRSLFQSRLEELARATTRTDPVAVLLLDLDDFKSVNESLGHVKGDQLLRAVALRLRNVVREDDLFARLGGDEFALLLESGPMPRTAEQAAARLVASLETPFQLDEIAVTVRASIGIAVDQPEQGMPQDLLRDADLAMYLAKQHGKNRYETVRPGMRDEALRSLGLITALRHAITNGEFEVHYQPIVSVSDTSPVGVEALVRWHHPTRGSVPPGEFIGVAETTGLIIALGDWVLNEACRQAQAWRRSGTVGDAFYVSVNLSPRQLAEPTLTDDVARALRESGLPPHALVLEITEGSFIRDFDAALHHLRALKGLGLRLAMDDFGTGYSSLNRLRTLPIDLVKVDKSFVDGLPDVPEDMALVRSVIEVARALGMTSIAEGVEEPDQFAALQELGCDAIQGYLFAKPMSAANTTRTLTRLAGPRAPR